MTPEQQPTDPARGWLSIEQAAATAGVSVNTVRRWMAAERVPFRHFAGRLRFPPDFLHDPRLATRGGKVVQTRG